MKDTKEFIYKIIASDGTATGFKVAGYPFLITNYHVVAGGKEVAVENHNKDRFLGKVIMVNTDLDLAFISVEELASANSSIILDEYLTVKENQMVTINGFPLGMSFTVTQGIVSLSQNDINNKNMIQTDAAINSGNSGGPMLTEDGIFVGVVTSKYRNAENMGFAIAYNDVIKQIKDYNFSEYTYRVRCNSCDSFVENETTFCDSCGAAINASVYEEFEKSYFTEIVENALIEELGMNPILCRTGTDEYWEFHKGNALIRIFINGNYIRITSPISKLPKKNLNDLLTYLTSGNEFPYSMGIYKNKIYLSYRTYEREIYYDEKNRLKHHIRNLALKADELSRFLKDKFACEMPDESKK